MRQRARQQIKEGKRIENKYKTKWEEKKRKEQKEMYPVQTIQRKTAKARVREKIRDSDQSTSRIRCFNMQINYLFSPFFEGADDYESIDCFHAIKSQYALPSALLLFHHHHSYFDWLTWKNLPTREEKKKTIQTPTYLTIQQTEKRNSNKMEFFSNNLNN